jgi:zinc protease
MPASILASLCRRFVAALLVLAVPAWPEDRQDPRIEFTKYTLPNGLEVILHQDRSVPLVAVEVWYHVGSGDELPGKSGFAHLFEHLMFQGTAHTGPDRHLPILRDLGASEVNGTTNPNRTSYYQLLPSNALEVALWLESERMGYLTTTLGAAALETQREVVRNERRQMYDNVPYGRERLAVHELLYPEGHPYRHLPIGLHEDLARASIEDVRAFLRTWYVPSNATLCVAGDFELDAARRRIDKWFGSFPAAPKPVHRRIGAPVLTSARRQVVRDPFATQCRIHYAWHSPALFAPGDAELDILAQALGNVGTGRLYRRLMVETGAATEVTAWQESNSLSSVFHIWVNLAEAAGLAEVEAALEEEIERVRSEPLGQRELRRTVAALEAAFVWGLEKLLARSELLQHYNHFRGRPDSIAWDLDRYRKADGSGIQAVAAQVLRRQARVEVLTLPDAEPGRTALPHAAPEPAEAVAEELTAAEKALTPGPSPALRARGESIVNPELSHLPQGGRGARGEAGDGVAEQGLAAAPAAGLPPLAYPDEPFRARMPRPEPSRPFRQPELERFELPNGVEVYLVRRPALPTVSMELLFPGGSIDDPPGKEGTAALCLDLLDDGAGKLGKLDFEAAQADIAAVVSAYASTDQQGLRLGTLRKSLDAALDLWAAALLEPALRASDHERNVQHELASLRQAASAPEALALRLFGPVFYGPSHPLGRLATEASLRSVGVGDCRRYLAERLRPRGAQLYVVGDITRAEVLDRIGGRLEGWTGAAAPGARVGPPQPAEGRIFFADAPGAEQSQIYVGHPGPPRQAPDYFATRLMMEVLGGGFSSRINMNLRESRGYTYGAQAYLHYSRTTGVVTAKAPVRPDATGPAIQELRREFEAMAAGPIREAELSREKNGLILGLQGRFVLGVKVLESVRDLVYFALPLDTYASFAERVAEVTLDQVQAAAREHLHPERLRVLVVGDARKVLPELRRLIETRSLGEGDLVILDADGRPLPERRED